MLVAFLIIAFGFTPFLLSLWVLRQDEARAQARLRLAIDSGFRRGLPMQRDRDQEYIEGLGYIIGDITCSFNARSSSIRCAINPFGPCQDCSHYEPRQMDEP